jgi:hypothetical protein
MIVARSDTKFINFLHQELSLSTADIAVALRSPGIRKRSFTHASLAVWSSRPRAARTDF